MAYWAGYTPTNRLILAGGEQEEVGEDLLATGTMTYMIPGALVTEGSYDSECAICEYNSVPIGFLGYEKEAILLRPTGTGALDTAYTQYDRVFVHQGRVVFQAIIGTKAGSTAIVKGQRLYAAAHGKVTNYDDNSGASFVGYAMESAASTDGNRVKVMWGR